MGKLSPRLRLAFAVSSVVLLAVLAVSPIKDTLSEWRGYKREYARFAQSRPDSKRLLADYQPGIESPTAMGALWSTAWRMRESPGCRNSGSRKRSCTGFRPT